MVNLVGVALHLGHELVFIRRLDGPTAVAAHSFNHGDEQDTRAFSPLIPAGLRPDGYLGLTFEHPAEELFDLRARGESGSCFD